MRPPLTCSYRFRSGIHATHEHCDDDVGLEATLIILEALIFFSSSLSLSFLFFSLLDYRVVIRETGLNGLNNTSSEAEIYLFFCSFFSFFSRPSAAAAATSTILLAQSCPINSRRRRSTEETYSLCVLHTEEEVNKFQVEANVVLLLLGTPRTSARASLAYVPIPKPGSVRGSGVSRSILSCSPSARDVVRDAACFRMLQNVFPCS